MENTQTMEGLEVKENDFSTEILSWIKQYKEILQEKGSLSKCNELYKWELLSKYSSAFNLEDPDFIENLKQVRFYNLMYMNAIAVISNRFCTLGKEKYIETLKRLFNEEVNIDDRIANYINESQELYNEVGETEKGFKHHQDERTAATLLSFRYPEKYSFYKKGTYTALCNELGIKRETKRCYGHYLSILQQIVPHIKADKELCNMIENETKNLIQSDILIAQDIVWQMFGSVKNEKNMEKQDFNGNFWTIQLHPTNVTYTPEEITSLVSTHKLIGMGKGWNNDGGAPKRFKEEMKIGDIVLVRQNGPLCLVEVTSECSDAPKQDIWFEIHRNIKILSFSPPIEEFKSDWTKGISLPPTLTKCNESNFVKYWYNKIKGNMKTYINLLKNSKNLILTGAPGTGKTYLAKQIAKEFIGEDYSDEQIGFVQFHPSYDYTDFVEGLRAEESESGEVTFKLHDGIFKRFCKRAIENDTIEKIEPQKTISQIIETKKLSDCSEVVWRKAIEWFKQEMDGKNVENYGIRVINDKIKLIRHHKEDEVSISDNSICDYIGKRKGYKSYGSYQAAIVRYLEAHYNVQKYTSSQEQPSEITASQAKAYVFIIDEINRGEISKIFGELFFSIDPGYRVKQADKFNKTHISTQYANIQSGDTIFDSELGKGYFYVPDNVYIIGTMNDIDRSVESMDFAMRRRFTWKEVTANERIEMFGDATWAKKAVERMKAINQAIESVPGLGKAYHIGPAYFLKLKNYEEDSNKWESLWKYHLLPLVREYLRGMPSAEEIEKELENAYNLKNKSQQTDDTN